ncbi:hypothetical protein DFP72DRAFT_1170105 [Ephemerocybe angulata]|uniref:Uncharacterized protein n=1 Tax=Ephemerocybe angulata TaxID=980116 RepID=A0A8H6M6J0_9AGAR|nr:hypothetical protein DFP72DRAFT_1170105 [Tulosesus angulatus]
MPRSSTSSIPKHVFHNAIERVQHPPSRQGMFTLLPFKQLCANDFHPDYHTKPVPRAESQGAAKGVVSVQPPYPPPIMPPSGGNLMLLGGVAETAVYLLYILLAYLVLTRFLRKSTKRNMSTAPSRSTRSKTKPLPKGPQHNDTQAPIPKALLDLLHNCIQPPAAVTRSLLPPCSSIMLGLCGDVPPYGHPFPAIPVEVDSAWNTIQAHKVIEDLTISTASMPSCTERLPSFKEKFGELGRPDSTRHPMLRPTLPPLRCPGPELLALLRGREGYWREQSSSTSSSSSLSDEEALDGSGCGSSSDSTSFDGSAYSPGSQEAYPYPYAGTLGGYGEDVGVSSGDVVEPPRAFIMRPMWSWSVNEWQTWA